MKARNFFKSATELFKANWKVWVCLILVLFLIQVVPGIFLEVESKETFSFSLLIIEICLGLISMALGLGLISAGLKEVSATKASINDLVSVFDRRLLTIITVSIIMTAATMTVIGGSIMLGILLADTISTALLVLMSVTGLIMIVVAGAYLSIRLLFVQYIIVDANEGPIQSLKKSWQLSKGNISLLVRFLSYAVAINFLGLLLFGVGLLYTMPITTIATAMLYLHLNGPQHSKERLEFNNDLNSTTLN
mgnify:CR=1 FL=1